MKYPIISLLFFMNGYVLLAQTYEVGLFLGGTNFSGDVGSTSFLLPEDYLHKDKLSYGGIFKWNRSTRHSFRFTALRLNTYEHDLRSDNNRRIGRGYGFSTSLTELSAGIEFTFWDWDIHNGKSEIVPYLYTGPTLFFGEHQFVNASNQLESGGRNTNLAIPMVIGIKVNLSDHWVVAAEYGARYTFTDNLDGSAPTEFSGGSNFPSFGNPNTNDWYMFAGISLTYAFGRKPCYCNF